MDLYQIFVGRGILTTARRVNIDGPRSHPLLSVQRRQVELRKEMEVVTEWSAQWSRVSFDNVGRLMNNKKLTRGGGVRTAQALLTWSEKWKRSVVRPPGRLGAKVGQCCLVVDVEDVFLRYLKLNPSLLQDFTVASRKSRR